MPDSISRLPIRLYRAAQVQKLDQIAIEDFGIAGFKLMQTAGAIAFNEVLDRWPQIRYLQVFTGSGNNGGDGYIVAGLARERGIGVKLIELADGKKLRGVAQQARQWAQDKAVELTSYREYVSGQEGKHAHTVIIDALLGTGIDRHVEGDYALAIEDINGAGSPVLAIDIPSGLCADTGNSLGATVNADVTVTFIGMKQGLLTHRGRDFAGSIVFHDLDIPEEIFTSEAAPKPSARRIDINYATRHLKPRIKSSHKGIHGHVIIIGGDTSYGGAALLAAEAAFRAGAGLVSCITRSAHRPAVLARRPEIMVLGTEDEDAESKALELLGKATAIAIGPGLGQGEWSRRLLRQTLTVQVPGRIPLIVDADALRLLAQSERDESVLGNEFVRDADAGTNWILTPHPGEAAALLNCSVEEIQNDRFAAVVNLQDRWGGCCLLKGSGSLLCVPDAVLVGQEQAGTEKPLFLCSEGNPGMASAGMGDVLSGLVASLAAQGLSLQESLCCGVCIHGEAADMAVAVDGQRGTLASDLLPFIRLLVNASVDKAS